MVNPGPNGVPQVEAKVGKVMHEEGKGQCDVEGDWRAVAHPSVLKISKQSGEIIWEIGRRVHDIGHLW